mgnify:FL=1
MTKSNWETETCSRCGGTGNYSSHILYGTKCFKCRGAKILFTKRGIVAKKYYQESLKVDVSKIKLGDLIWEDNGWYRVQEITHIGISQGSVSGVPYEHQIYGFRIGAEYTTNSCINVKRYPQDENGKSCKVAFKKNLAKALEYQSKLGKHGKVLKKYQEVS